MAINKLIIIGIVILFCVVSFFGGYQYKEYEVEYLKKVPFVPTYADTTGIGVRYHSDMDLLNDEVFKKNLVLLLEYYKKDYLLLDGKILIDKILSKDHEILVNYTEKAKRGFVPSSNIREAVSDEEYKEYLKNKYPDHYHKFEIFKNKNDG